MTRKHTLSSKTTPRRVVDDFKLIRGIGRITEKRLHDAGIQTYSQFAQLSVQAITSIIPNLSIHQVIKQDWIKQARRLASGVSKPRQKREKVIPIVRQHYENFTFEFLLNEKNKIRRLRIMHVQSGDVNTWASWNQNEISQFLSHHTGAKLIHATPDLAVATPEPVTQPATQFSKPEPEKVNVPLPAPAVPVVEIPTNSLPEKPIPQPVSTKQFDTIRLVKWTNFLANSNQPVNSLSHDQNFVMKLILDLSKTSLSDSTQLNVTGMIFAKKMGERARQIIGETENTIPYAPTIDLTISKASLSPGLYRLDAMIKLDPIGVKVPAIEANYQGELLQVY